MIAVLASMGGVLITSAAVVAFILVVIAAARDPWIRGDR